MSGLRYLRVEVSDLHEPGLLATLNPGGARPPHVLRVRSGACAPSESKLAAPPTAHLWLFKVLLLNCFEGCNAAIYHTFKLVIDIHAQHIRFVFARFFERIELAAQ